MSEWKALINVRGGTREIRFVAGGWRRAFAVAFKQGHVVDLENLGGCRG